MGPASPPVPPTSSIPVTATDITVFHKEKHIAYWLRCLRTPLPTAYTSTDSARMMLAFFTVSALDLLGALFDPVTAAERADCAAWIYRCQCHGGGFRGCPATDFGGRADAHNAKWDVPSVPATYFALAALGVLGDDLAGVDRRGCLRWLRRMQREDGSFGEMLGPDGTVQGGRDTRFAYCAMAVRWMLRGRAEGEVDGVLDVDVEALIGCIRASQTYDGGVSETPFHEAHAGFTYCAIAALSLLERLPHSDNKSGLPSGLPCYDTLLQWLVARLTTTIEEDQEDFSDEEEPSAFPASSFGKYPFHHPTSIDRASTPEEPPEPPWTGLNGRPNKIADTCYAFWVLSSIKLLTPQPMAHPHAPIRRYLLEKTQHLVAGGFGKLPGDPPDIYHSYLGLAALSLLETGEGVIEQLDPALCMSWRARIWFERLKGQGS